MNSSGQINTRKSTFLKTFLILLSIFVTASMFPFLFLHAKEKITGLNGYYKTMNFEVWAKNNELAEKIAKSAETFYKGLLKDLKYGGMLKMRCKIYIFAHRQAFLEHLGGKAVDATYAGAMAFPRRPQRNPEVYGYECEGMLEYILPHELTHHIYREFTVGIDITTPIPLWINEGMACYEEHNPRYIKTVEAAVHENGFINLQEILVLSAIRMIWGEESSFMPNLQASLSS